MRRPGIWTWVQGGAFWLLFLALCWLAGRGLAWALDGAWSWTPSWHAAVPAALVAAGLLGRWAWWRWGKGRRYYCSLGLIPEQGHSGACQDHDNAYGRWGRRHADGRLYTRREADDELWAACVAAGMPRWKAAAAWVFIRLALGWRWDGTKESKQPAKGSA